MDVDESQASGETKKKKRKKDKQNAEEKDSVKEEVILEEVVESKKRKKKTKSKIDTNEDDKKTTNDDNTDSVVDDVSDKKKRKKDKKQAKEAKNEQEKLVSEESDAIETDMQEDSEVLTPQELGLIDLSDCVTPKNYKKRVVSLIKCIKARTKRLDRVEEKITNIETKGLNAKNKKYHTAMNLEKLVMEERIKKLVDALKLAQDKLKDFDLKANPDYKKKKLEKISANKTNEQKNERKEKENEAVKEKASTLKVKVVEDLKPVVEVPSAKEFWSMEPEIVNETKDEESSSSEDEVSDLYENFFCKNIKCLKSWYKI